MALLPFPVMAPITGTVLFWIPLKEIFHLVRYPNRQSTITGTGRDSFRNISGTGLCLFRYGHSLGPIPKLGSMRMVPFPVRGSACSGTVIHWVPYRYWTLCAWSHFRYGALPVPVRSFTGSRTETGLNAHGPISGMGLCQFRYGHSLGPTPILDSMRGGFARWWVCDSMTTARRMTTSTTMVTARRVTTLTTMATARRATTTMTMVTARRDTTMRTNAQHATTRMMATDVDGR